MNILVATGLYPPEGGGPATYARHLNDELPARVDKVTVVKFADVRHLPKIIRHIGYTAMVVRRAWRADVILALDPVSVGLPAWIASFVTRTPLVVKVVGDYAWEQGRQRFGVRVLLDDFVRTKQSSLFVRFFQKVQTFVVSKAMRVIVPSQYMKGIVVAWGIPKEKISVVYNAGPVEREMGHKNVLRGLLKYHDKFIVTVGRLVPWKHIDEIIDAVGKLGSAGLTPKLLIIGDGPDEKKLMDHVEKKGMQEQVLFTGRLPNDITLAYIKAADVFVLNSSYEGFSHLLLESLTIGTPTAATNVGGNPELVVDGKTGLLVPVHDTQALSKALQRLLTDEMLRRNVSSNGKRAAGKYTVDRMVRETRGILETYAGS